MTKETWDGRFLEDFAVGDVYRHAHGRTVNETDNTWFTLLTNNSHQIHINADYAAKTEFGRPLVVSTLTLAIITGLSVPDVSQNAVAIARPENIDMNQELHCRQYCGSVPPECAIGTDA